MRFYENPELNRLFLDLVHKHAVESSTCKKARVGTAIVYLRDDGELGIVFGANRGSEYNCVRACAGCRRVVLFGDDSQAHRGKPLDVKTGCQNHSEIDALDNLVQSQILRSKSGESFTLPSLICAYVTRYPCENCLRSLAEAGVKTVVYGRDFAVAGSSFGIRLIHEKSWEGWKTTESGDDNR